MSLRIITVVVVLAIGILAYVAWNRNTARNEPAPEESGAPGGPAPGGSPQMGGGAPPMLDPGVQWQVPKRWLAQLAGGMRLATYVIPGPESGGDDAECAVYYFGPGQGGGVDANLERWVGEFRDPEKPVRSTREIHGFRVSQVEVGGTYLAHGGSMGEAGSEKPGWTLLGAIVEAPNGSIFFKLTGPAGTVHGAEKEFDALLASLATK